MTFQSRGLVILIFFYVSCSFTRKEGNKIQDFIYAINTSIFSTSIFVADKCCTSFVFQIICSIKVSCVPSDGYFWPILPILRCIELVLLKELLEILLR